MKTHTKTLALGLMLAAGVAIAKEGVQNPVVKARMDAMATIGANVKVLGDMAGGKAPFDAAKAAEAGGMISGTAVQITDLFQPQETDPVTEAKPEIWANWDDFSGKAEALFKASLALDTTSLEGVQAGMAGLGGACKACHSTYRM